MTAEQFTYWLQGFAELNEQPPSPEQWASIREHLALVFSKQTPTFRAGKLPPGILGPLDGASAVPSVPPARAIC